MAPRLSPTPHYYRDNSGKEGPARTLFIACEGSVRKLDSAYWMGGGVSKELVLKDMNVAGVPDAQYIRMSTENKRSSPENQKEAKASLAEARGLSREHARVGKADGSKG